MDAPADFQNLLLSVGRLEGQLRELVHGMNNLTQANIHMSNDVAKMALEIAKFATVPEEIAALKARVGALEIEETKRGAVMGFGGWLLSLIPAGGIAAIVAAAFEFFKGKHP